MDARIWAEEHFLCETGLGKRGPLFLRSSTVRTLTLEFVSLPISAMALPDLQGSAALGAVRPAGGSGQIRGSSTHNGSAGSLFSTGFLFSRAPSAFAEHQGTLLVIESESLYVAT